MTMHIQARTIRDRLKNSKPAHCFRVWEYLKRNNTLKNNANTANYASIHELCPSGAILVAIFACFNENDVEQAHISLVNSYRSGERYYKKGRPFGAKNKNRTMSTDDDAIDVLKELGVEDYNDSDDVNYRGISADMVYIDEMIETEKNKQITQPPFASQNNNAFDATKIKELIAESMQDFIKAYGRDKDQLQSALKTFVTLTAETMQKEMDQRFNEMKPNIVELHSVNLPPILLGVQHKNFEKLLKICSSKLRNGSHNNVWIYGPAGTGKSTAAENVAKALNLDFYSDGKMSDETKVLGYQDANGTYRSTNFRKAFEHGGIYLADEIDGSMPDALLALNGALANGHCSFPDKIVCRHPDFIFLAAANTTGTGGTIEYVGRFKQDAAFNDRFVFLDWPLDEALEASLVTNTEWLGYVRLVRHNLSVSTIKGHLITPRATIYGESLLAAGLEFDTVVEMVLKKGLTNSQWDMVK